MCRCVQGCVHVSVEEGQNRALLGQSVRAGGSGVADPEPPYPALPVALLV